MTKIQDNNHEAYLRHQNFQNFMERVEYYAEIDYWATNLDKSEVRLTTFDDDVHIGILADNPDMVVMQTYSGNHQIMKANIKSIKKIAKKCIGCEHYISDEFCTPYEEKDYDFEIDGAYKEHNCPNYRQKNWKE